MTHVYANNELVDMLLMYGKCKPQRQLVATQNVFPIDTFVTRKLACIQKLNLCAISSDVVTIFDYIDIDNVIL
ncbi:hypothetical protein NQ317_001611 [Molorchus minor]|uniref:Uncharacterized protein n=1 Tax=Molorchus minor TaxID=1323400 RepID=A0ABQ9JS72_9CUCU|nr:hypothetical protein NQ317_001611 [Molorchus minor]